MLCRRRAGLQRHHDRTEVYARQLDCRVVDAGEAQHADEVPGMHRMLSVPVPIGSHRAHSPPQFAIADGVEPRQEVQRRAPGRCIGDHFAGTLAQRRPVGVALHHGCHGLGDAQTGPADRLGDRFVGTGIPELGILDIQPLSSERQPFPLVLLGTGILHVRASDESHGYLTPDR